MCVRYSMSRNGVLSGECNTDIGLCRILGWGPIELTASDREAAEPGFHRQMPAGERASRTPVLTPSTWLTSSALAPPLPPCHHVITAAEFTLFVKNNIFFPSFKASFTNVGLGNATKEYQSSCLWDTFNNKYCPVFRIRDILTNGRPPATHTAAKSSAREVTGMVSCVLHASRRVPPPNYPCASVYE